MLLILLILDFGFVFLMPQNDRLAAACQSLVEQAYSAHSLDNISVICVTPLACDMVREEEAEAGAEATA